MEPVSFTDLPKPFLQLLLNTIDPVTKLTLRSCSKGVLCLVDELSDCLFCCVKDAERVSISKLLHVLSRLSAGITTLLLPELKLVPDVTFTSGAFSRLEHLVVNYRLYKLCQCLATAARTSLHTVSIVPGRRKGSHWQAKLTKMLQVLQEVQSLRSLHLSLHCTQATAALVGQLPQLQLLQLSVVKAPGDTTPHPEHLFDQKLWNVATEPLTALTSLNLNLPVLLNHQTAEQLHWPSTLQSLQLHMQHSDAESETPAGGGFDVTGLAAAQLLLHNMPALPQLTRLVVQAHSPNDWFAGPELQLSRQAANSLGQLLQLRSLHLLVGHWQLSLRQLQPLSSCVHLTQLVLSELVMGFSDEGLDDQMGTRLTREEAAAVAAGVAAAAGAGATEQHQQQQQQQAGCPLPSSPGSSRSAAGGAAAAAAAAATVMTVGGHSVRVPLLPQLESLHCTTLWWRLPLVVLAPSLKDVAYKRLRNLGYGSFVLPDLQDWEEEQLPPVFEGLLQGGNAAAAGPGGAPLEQPLGGLLGAILAPQGGFHPHNQQHINNNNDHNINNNDEQDAEAAAMEAAFVNPPNLLELQQDVEMFLAPAAEEEQLDAAQQQQQQQLLQDMHHFAAAHEGAGPAQLQQQHGHDDAAGAAVLAHLDAQLAAAHEDAAAIQAAMQDLQQQGELVVQQEQQQALVLWHHQQQHHQQQQQQHGEGNGAGAANVWEQLMHWDVDMGEALVQPIAAEHAAAAALNEALAVNQADLLWPHQQQQPPPAAAAAAAAAAVAPASSAVATPALNDAPVHRAYGDVLRGQRCLECLDVCVTALCKIMHSSSSPLAFLKCLKLHMLGEVRLAPGGMPTLPQLTALEFYLPDERNWDADYNDWEDIALWQNQHSVRSITIRGTFHAGGFFAPGHLQLAHRSMRLVQQLRFVNCGDLHTDRLQQVVESKLSPLVIVEGCGASSSNSRAAAAATAAAEHTANAPGSDAAAATADFLDLDDDLLFHQPEQHGDMQHAQEMLDAEQAAASSSSTASSESIATAAVATGGEVPSELLNARELNSTPQLVSKGLVMRLTVNAAAHGVELKWVDAPAHWRVWLQ